MRKRILLILVGVLLMASCLVCSKPAVFAFTIAEDSWTSKAPMNVARGALGVAAVNNKIYAIGGSAKDVRLATTKEFLSTNEEYDPETNTWASRTAMPTPRAAFAITSYQNKIYCIGGKTSSGYTGVNEVYDVETDTWETKTPMPTARGFVTANVVNGRIYVIGGSIIGGGTTVNEVYDPASDTWTTGTSMPAYGGYVSTVFDAKIYVMTDSALLIYNPAIDDWSRGTPKPSGIGIGAAVATTGIFAPKRIYVVEDSRSGAYTVEIYDPENDAWKVGTKRSITVYPNIMDFGVAITNDKLYVLGGYVCDASYLVSGSGVFSPLYLNEQYTPIGYYSPNSFDDREAPEIEVSSPENKTYYNTNVTLGFVVNEATSWIGYSLDGQNNVTVVGNVTLDGLSVGLHNVTVYANDTFGNFASETVQFGVAEPFPVVPVAAASVTTLVVVVVGLLVYFKKRKYIA
jgi:hypothetical protein